VTAILNNLKIWSIDTDKSFEVAAWINEAKCMIEAFENTPFYF
jgi:hypothetical protein